MQEILPGLFLGPYSYSKEFNQLKANGITHIVSIRDASEKRIIRPRFPEHFVYFEIEVSDSPNERLIPHFPAAKQFIDEALNGGGRVFVHCNGGISRSPAFVVAYVMETAKMDYQCAYTFVQNRRFCMNPNEGFKVQLKVSVDGGSSVELSRIMEGWKEGGRELERKGSVSYPEKTECEMVENILEKELL